MLEQVTSTDVVTCISCKYAYVSLINRLTGGQRFARCTRTKKTTTVVDIVTGKTSTSYSDMNYCNTERQQYKGLNNECGPQGRYWVPKDTRDVFKLLKRS